MYTQERVLTLYTQERVLTLYTQERVHVREHIVYTGAEHFPSGAADCVLLGINSNV